MNNTHITVHPEKGRLATLTPDEEQKLKDMWAHFLDYCGILPPALKTVTSSLTQHPTEQEKPKKSSWFGRKSSTPNNEPSTNGNASQNEVAAFKTAVKELPGKDVLESAFSMTRSDNPDSLFLRFLRARKWNVKAALEMMGHTLYWRINDGRPEDLLLKGEIGAIEDNYDELLLQFRAKKAWIYGNDKHGRPIVHVHPYRHDPKSQGIKAVQDFTVFIIENARLCLQEPVDTATIFFDLSKFSLSNMDYGAVKFLIACFEGHYPESLGCLLIHKAPWIFSGIWSVIKNWIDPVVAQKIVFTRTYDDLAKFMDDDVIETEHGGHCSFEYEYIEPTREESIKTFDKETREKYTTKQAELAKKFQEATIDWIKSKDKETNEKTKAEKSRIAHELTTLYWESDEYLRARSIIDRTKVLDQFKTLHKNWTVAPAEE